MIFLFYAAVAVRDGAASSASSRLSLDLLSKPAACFRCAGLWPDDPAYHAHRGVVLHEFGHMLNLSHEHQSPRKDLTWNDAQIIADMARRSDWSEDKTRGNIINRVKMADDLIVSDHFDTVSVMSYSFPAT